MIACILVGCGSSGRDDLSNSTEVEEEAAEETDAEAEEESTEVTIVEVEEEAAISHSNPRKRLCGNWCIPILQRHEHGRQDLLKP